MLKYLYKKRISIRNEIIPNYDLLQNMAVSEYKKLSKIDEFELTADDIFWKMTSSIICSNKTIPKLKLNKIKEEIKKYELLLGQIKIEKNKNKIRKLNCN